MKYFFLLEGWHIGRIWEFGGLWNAAARRRQPDICRTNIQIVENGDRLWLYRVEDAVLMVEVIPDADLPPESDAKSIGQVVLKRLITAEQVIDHIGTAQALHLK